MTPMDDAQIDALLRDGDETAPAELRDVVTALVRNEPRPQDHVEPSRRRLVVVVSVAATLVLLVIGLVVVAGAADDPAPAIDTMVPTTNEPSTTSTPPTVPTTTVPATTVLDAEAARLDSLPAADPVTVVARPGVTWLVPEVVPSSYSLRVAYEAPRHGRDVRELVYLSDDCDIGDIPIEYLANQCDFDGTIGGPNVAGTIWIRTSFGDDQQSAISWDVGPENVLAEPRLLTPEGDIAGVVYPGNGFFSGQIIIERRMDDALVSIEISGDTDIDQWVPMVESIRAIDESELAYLPLGDQYDEFGPVVAALDTGDVELRAQYNGIDFGLHAGDKTTAPFSGPTPANPVAGTYDTPRGNILYGIVEPDVAELRFEFDTGDDPITVLPGDLSGTFRRQFFITEIPRGTLRVGYPDRPGITMYALDANGTELARYKITDEGFSKLTPDE